MNSFDSCDEKRDSFLNYATRTQTHTRKQANSGKVVRRADYILSKNKNILSKNKQNIYTSSVA